MMHEKGKRIILSNYLIQNINNYWGIRKFINRHTRWGKLRWKIGGMKYLSELIGNAVFMSSLPILLWEPSRITITFALLISTLKVVGDLYIGKKIRSDMKPFLYILSPIKDLIIGCIWFVPILSNTVAWRGNRYIIGKNSLLSPAPDTGVWSWGYRLLYAIKTRLA
jgi:ceramide glucosyltransferase